MTIYMAKGKEHPFSPRHDGQGCRQLDEIVDHRSIECGAEKGDKIHTGTRPPPPELDFPPPVCTMCGKDTYHDGDSFNCDPCGAYWSGNGPGDWSDPEVLVCTSSSKPFDHDNLAPEHEHIRHHLRHCILPLDHNGDHRADEFNTWKDTP